MSENNESMTLCGGKCNIVKYQVGKRGRRVVLLGLYVDFEFVMYG